MKYANMEYTCRILDRLAESAYRKGGIEYMRNSLNRAIDRIWNSVGGMT